MQDFLYKLNFLDGLFTENEFTFFKNMNSYKKDIEKQLKDAINQRDKVVEYINNFDIVSTTESDYSLLNDSQIAFEAINNTIANLNTLKENLEGIEKYILELILKIETSTIDNQDLNISVYSIKIEINQFDTFSKKVSDTIISNSTIVNNFLNQFYNNYKEHSLKKEMSSSTHLTDKQKKDTSDFSFTNSEIKDNPVLKISEKDNKVYLPYSKSEIFNFLDSYPNVYKNCKHVINREYIVDLTFYNRHPVLARFRETYALIRDREMKPIMDAFKRSIDLMFRYELNPAIIAGLKSENQLDEYLDCVKQNTLNEFKPFKIIFEVNPLSKRNKVLI